MPFRRARKEGAAELEAEQDDAEIDDGLDRDMHRKRRPAKRRVRAARSSRGIEGRQNAGNHCAGQRAARQAVDGEHLPARSARHASRHRLRPTPLRARSPRECAGTAPAIGGTSLSWGRAAAWWPQSNGHSQKVRPLSAKIERDGEVRERCRGSQMRLEARSVSNRYGGVNRQWRGSRRRARTRRDHRFDTCGMPPGLRSPGRLEQRLWRGGADQARDVNSWSYSLAVLRKLSLCSPTSVSLSPPSTRSAVAPWEQVKLSERPSSLSRPAVCPG